MPETSKHLIPLFGRQPLRFVSGQGARLTDESGTTYLDALSGIAVCGLGHAHPDLVSAMQQQLETLWHTSNLYHIQTQEQAGEKLCSYAGMEQVFFANSGAESNEAALKLARLYAHQKGFARPKVVVMDGAFHGRTLLTLSATANPKVKQGFYPLDQDFIRVEFGSLEAVEAVNDPEVCAVLVEPIQGEGGIQVPSMGLKAYLEGLRSLCDQRGWLLMLDEIQTGNGRTGKPYAYMHSSIRPDVLTSAKGLGSGFPVGACMVAGKAVGVFSPGSHGSTYGGTPLQCRAVLETLNLFERLSIDTLAQSTGESMQRTLKEALEPLGVNVRGAGMMIGAELPKPCAELVDLARENEHMLINVTAGSVVRLLPPLNIDQDTAHEICERVIRLIKNFLAA